MPALFFFQCGAIYASDLENVVDQANRLHLSESKRWHSLLHLKESKPQIIDSKFLLSIDDTFSAKAEMQKTIALFFAHPAEAKCRFPARLLFLSKHLDFKNADLKPSKNCPDLAKYKRFVPFDEINLIFASEVLASASSMMGHTFLNVSGINVNENQVSHSISFFTEFDTLNPFKLIYDGILGGMQGFFIVRPYSIDFERYSAEEGRNVWSYSLDLSDYQRELIKLHIWELKDIEIEYLFQNYNCATLTLYVLSVANPDLREEERLYVSPVDVAKAAATANIIKNSAVTLADDWELNLLHQELDPALLAKIQSLVFENAQLDFESLDKKSRLLAKEYLTLLISKPDTNALLSSERLVDLAQITDGFDRAELAFDLTQNRNPIHSPQDTIIGTSITSISDDTMLDFRFLPASHYLYGNNSQYFSESELKIGEVVLRANLDSSNIKLQSLTLYSVESFVPTSQIIPQLSGSFFMGYKHRLNSDLEEKGVLEISGAFGKSMKLHKDIMIYGMLGLGLAGNRAEAFIFADPQVGAIINLVGDSKAILEHSVALGQFNDDALTHSTSITFAWHGLNNMTAHMSFKSEAIEDMRRNEFSLGFDYHF